MKKTILVLSLVFAAGAVFAQKKTTASATVGFDAATPKDALPVAENKTVVGSIDTKSGAVAFEAAVANFAFSNPKMQEHFNGANWLNSAQFPKITYTGTIDKVNKVNFSKNGSYDVKVNGTMTVKGVTKPVNVDGKIVVVDGKIRVSAKFSIMLSDYGITGQPIEAGKVDNETKITVSAEF